MYLTEQLSRKKKCKTVAKFPTDHAIPKIANTGSFKTKKMISYERVQQELRKELQQMQMKEILKDYHTNPYFRTKVDIILAQQHKNMVQRQGTQSIQSENKHPSQQKWQTFLTKDHIDKRVKKNKMECIKKEIVNLAKSPQKLVNIEEQK